MLQGPLSRRASEGFPPGYVDDVVGPTGLRTDPLEELLQRGDQQRGLALPQQVHEHHLLLQGQLQQAQAVQHCRLQVLLACRVEQVRRMKKFKNA